MRPLYRDRHGWLSDGAYRVNNAANANHVHATRRPEASYFNEDEDVELLTLEAARRADRDNLWGAHNPNQPDKAKVDVGRPIGVHYRTGRPTRTVNVMRRSKGTPDGRNIHASPGSATDE